MTALLAAALSAAIGLLIRQNLLVPVIFLLA